MIAAAHEIEDDSVVALDRLVGAITALENVVEAWEPEQQLTVQALKSAVDDLHAEALRRLIRRLKDHPASGAELRAALADRVVYGVLRHHGIVRASLQERVQAALAEVRPNLHAHGGDVELIEINAPDTVALRLVGACHGCPSSKQTLTEGVERALRRHAPEILHVQHVTGTQHSSNAERGDTGVAGTEPRVHFVSPFAAHADNAWVDVAPISALTPPGPFVRDVDGVSVLIWAQGDSLSCVENACAHMAWPLADGEIVDGVVTCPQHGFRFDLSTGECLTVPQVQLRVHAVRVLGDRLQVRLER